MSLFPRAPQVRHSKVRFNEVRRFGGGAAPIATYIPQTSPRRPVNACRRSKLRETGDTIRERNHASSPENIKRAGRARGGVRRKGDRGEKESGVKEDGATAFETRAGRVCQRRKRHRRRPEEGARHASPARARMPRAVPHANRARSFARRPPRTLG